MAPPSLIVHHGLTGLGQISPGAVLSIGNFDGVHRGHQHILNIAAGHKASNPGAKLVVGTFEPHPMTVLRPGHAPPRLTPPALKREVLAAIGVDELVVLPPEPAVLNLSAEAFWAVLRDQVRPSHMVEGESFTFGKGRGGTIDRLREWSAGSGIELHVVKPFQLPLLNMQMVPVSSSIIRWMLGHGRVRDAAICLGRPYTLEGPIVRGHQRGREIGFPTANLDCSSQLVPADGVYAARCTIDGRTWPAALSIGTMPTFGENDRQVEAHLVGFTGDLYGQTLRIDILDWLREQWKFNGIEPLKEQLARDIVQTLARLTLQPERPVVSAEANA